MFRHRSANFRESTNTEEDKPNIPIHALTRFTLTLTVSGINTIVELFLRFADRASQYNLGN